MGAPSIAFFAMGGFPLLPRDAALHGPALDRHLLLNLWILLTLLVLAHVLLFAGLLLRRRTRPTSLGWVEYLPVAALTLLFAFLTLRAERLWAATRYTGADPGALQVEATGMQFAWYFRYPGADAAFGRIDPALIAPGEGNPLGLDPADPHGLDDRVRSELVLPAGREVDLRLRAQDVIHGFAVPELRLKQNAVPGQILHIHFIPTVPGTYAILCTQLCGSGHARMNANLRVLSPQAFAQWQAGVYGAGAPSPPVPHASRFDREEWVAGPRLGDRASSPTHRKGAMNGAQILLAASPTRGAGLRP